MATKTHGGKLNRDVMQGVLLRRAFRGGGEIATMKKAHSLECLAADRLCARGLMERIESSADICVLEMDDKIVSRYRLTSDGWLYCERVYGAQPLL